MLIKEFVIELINWLLILKLYSFILLREFIKIFDGFIFVEYKYRDGFKVIVSLYYIKYFRKR